MITEQAREVKYESCNETNSYNIYQSNVCFDQEQYYCDGNTPRKLTYSDANCVTITDNITLANDCSNGTRYSCVEKPKIDYKEYCSKTYYADSACQIAAYDYVFKVGSCHYFNLEDSHVYFQIDDVLYDIRYIGTTDCSLPNYHAEMTNVSVCSEISTGTFKIECQRSATFKYKKIYYLVDDKPVYEEVYLSEYTEGGLTSYFFENYEVVIDSVNFFIDYYYNYTDYVSFPTQFLSFTEDTLLIKIYNSENSCINSPSDFVKAVISKEDPCENGFENSDSSYILYARMVNENEFNLTHYYTSAKKRFSCNNVEYINGTLNNCDIIPFLSDFSVSKIPTPSVIINSTCDEKSCYLTGNFTLNGDIEVHFTLNIINTTLTIPISFNGSFHVTNYGMIYIEESILELNVENDVEYEEFKKKFNEDGIYQYTLLEGGYNGMFLSIDINLRSSTCDSIESDISHGAERIEVAFKLSEAECSNDQKGGLKWWIILLICLGIVIALVVTFILLLACNEKFRSVVLPYRTK